MLTYGADQAETVDSDFENLQKLEAYLKEHKDKVLYQVEPHVIGYKVLKEDIVLNTKNTY